MVEELYNQNKLGLKVSKSSLTSSNLEESCKLLDKSPDSASTATKLRLSGSASSFWKRKEVVYREKLMETVVEYDEEEFKKVSTTQKD